MNATSYAMNIPDIFNLVQSYLYPMPNFTTQQQIDRFYKNHKDLQTLEALVPPRLDEYKAKMKEWKTAYDTQSKLRKEIKTLESNIKNKITGKIRSSQIRLKELGVVKNPQTKRMEYPYNNVRLYSMMRWFENGQKPFNHTGISMDIGRETREEFRLRYEAYVLHSKKGDECREKNRAIFKNAVGDNYDRVCVPL